MNIIALLRNVTELKDVKIKLLPIPDCELHKDFEWIRDEYKKWSKEYSVANNRMDEMLAFCFCLSYPNTTKEKALNIVKSQDYTFYIDKYLLDARKERSADIAQKVVQSLLTILKNGVCNQNYIPGQRMLSSLEPVKQEMSSNQWLREEQLIEKHLLTHLDIHCNYWLKNKTIPIEEYVLKRFNESVSFSDYAANVEIPTHIWNNQMVKTFYNKIIEMGLALDDYYMAKTKIMSEDITSRVISLIVSKGCTLQEAFDLQFEYSMNLYKECTELRDKIIGDKELASDELISWVNTAFNVPFCMFKVISRAIQLEINEDFTLKSSKWDQMYTELISKGHNTVDPWDLHTHTY